MPPAQRLIGFWLFYMAGMGLIFPFQSLYLSENAGLAGSQLGLVLALRPMVGMAGQPLWGHLADRTGSRVRVLTLLALGAALTHLLFPFARGFLPVAAAMVLVSIFTTSMIPMGSAVTMAALGPRATDFGRIRVWGTVGFLVCVVTFPYALDVIDRASGRVASPGGPSEPSLHWMFWFAAGFSAVAAIFPMRSRTRGEPELRARRGDLRGLLAHAPFRRVLSYTLCSFVFLQGPILLFPLLVRDRGGSLDDLSRMWIPMIALEIPLLIWSGAMFRRLGPRVLIAIGVFADGLRWTLASFAQDLRVIFVLMLLHGVVVACLLLGVQLYVDAVVPGRLRATAQGALAMAGVSFGAILSSLVAGYLLEGPGIDAVCRLGGGLALVLGVLTPFWLPKPRRSGE